MLVGFESSIQWLLDVWPIPWRPAQPQLKLPFAALAAPSLEELLVFARRLGTLPTPLPPSMDAAANVGPLPWHLVPCLLWAYALVKWPIPENPHQCAWHTGEGFFSEIRCHA